MAILTSKYEKQPDPPTRGKRRLLVLSTGGSATQYIQYALKDVGIRIRHMRTITNDCHGQVGPQYIADVQWLQWPNRFGKRTDWGWQHIFHQVRHPLKTIASIMSSRLRRWWNEKYTAFWGRFFPLPKWERDSAVQVETLARYWLGANRMAAKVAEFTYRVEDLTRGRATWDEFLRRLDITRAPIGGRHKGIHKRSVRKYEWDEIAQPLRAEVQEYARYLGYKI